jgi:glycine cleavage system H protein
MATPTDCKYSTSHEWHRLSGDVLTLGLTRYAVDALTDVTYATVKPVGTAIAAGKSLGEVESVKTTSDVYSAVAGTIVEVNQAVVSDPSKLNADPYSNWLVKLKVTDTSGMEKLLSAADYDKQFPSGH